MCYHTKLTKSQEELVKKFDVEVSDFVNKYYKTGDYNGFDHPGTPIIDQQNYLVMAVWGLMPWWTSDLKVRNKTLNTRIETAHQNKLVNDVLDSRCLIFADGFYEWQWLDKAGKRKQKYKLSLPGDELFVFGGVFQYWIGPDLDDIPSYTIFTTEANPLMAEIHNTKKRMPVIVKNAMEWLQGGELIMDNDRLVAEKVYDKPTTGSLF